MQGAATTTTGSNNTAVGSSALYSNTTASSNVAVGYQAGYSNTTGTNVTFVGLGAGYSNTNGNYVTYIGTSAGYYQTGGQNTALGVVAFQGSTTPANNTGTLNVAVGYAAMVANTSGSNNTAIGHSALNANTTASNNTAVGYQAAYLNTIGTSNTVVGYQAMSSQTVTGSGNSVFGSTAALNITSGQNNTAIGTNSMRHQTTGSNNTAVGYGSLGLQNSPTNYAFSYSTAVGSDALAYNQASNNTAVGYQAGYSNTTGGYNAILGYQSGYNVNTNYNTFIGYQAGYGSGGTMTGARNTGVGVFAGYSLTSGNYNAFFGSLSSGGGSAGSSITTGSSNTILGNYTGNQGGLDIRTSSNYIVLSDGDGNPRLAYNGSGVGFLAASSTSTCVFVSGVNQNTLGSYYGDDVDDRSFWINYNGYQDGATRYRTFKVADGKNNSVLTVTGSTHVVKLDYGQLEFPATQNASSNANTLDDYEEGEANVTYAPESSGTITVDTNNDRIAYTKIGRQVTITGQVQISAVSSPSGGYVHVNGLPFASADLTEASGRIGGAVTFYDESANSYTAKGVLMLEGSTQARLYIDASTVAASDGFIFSFSYFTT
jgi:hypothetical protein